MTWGKRDGMIVHESDPYNAEPPPGELAPDFITPVDLFYSRNHGPIPSIDDTGWTLTVDGLVTHPRQLSLTELRDFAPVTVTATLQCAGNRRAAMAEVKEIPGEDPWGPSATSNASWTGVRLVDVLAAAGPGDTPADAHVAFEAPDVSDLADPPQVYGGSIPLAKACTPEVLLAWAMNGAALERAHGAPVRLVVPGYIGARSVKWVERITVQRDPSDNYFQATAYRLLAADADPDQAGPGDGISLGPVALNAAILSPVADDHVAAGTVEVQGYALTDGTRQIARVEVSGDDGATWIEATIKPNDARFAWTRWHTAVQLTAGEHILAVRAWDDTGSVQPESAATIWNPKGYANTSWDRVRVTAQPADR